MKTSTVALATLVGLSLPLAAAAQDSRTVRTIGRSGQVEVVLGERGGKYTLVGINRGNREARVKFTARITCKNKKTATENVDMTIKAGGRNGQAWSPFPCGNDSQIQNLSASNLSANEQGPTVRGGGGGGGGGGAPRVISEGPIETKLKRGMPGVRLGLNISSQSFENPEVAFGPKADTGFQPGPSFGVLWDMAFNKMFGLRAVGEVVLKGASIDGLRNDADEEVDAYTNLWFVQATPMLTVRFGDVNKGIRPFLQVGPYLALLVVADTKIDGITAGENADGEGEDKSREFYTSFDAGISFGGGAYFNLGSAGVLSADFRADIGLLNTADIDYWRKIDRKQDISNLGFQFAVAYHF
jgi:hypothetical protein